MKKKVERSYKLLDNKIRKYTAIINLKILLENLDTY